MSFSNQLIEKLKEIKNIKTDAEVAKLIPEMNSGNLSKIRKQKENRHLNESQALWIAEQCNLDKTAVLVELARECSRNEKAQIIWSDLAKKIKAATSAILLAGLLLFSSIQGDFRLKRVFVP